MADRASGPGRTDPPDRSRAGDLPTTAACGFLPCRPAGPGPLAPERTTTMNRLFPVVSALLGTTALLSAQVPHGSSVIGVIANVAPGEGLFLADRAGGNVAVTGLLAAGSATSNVNAVALDPIDDRVWIATSSNNQLNWLRITGSTVSQFQQFGTAGTTTSIAAITFDANANPIVCFGTGATGGLFRFDRTLGGAGVLIGGVPGTTAHNAICRDPAGNLYAGMFNGQVHVFLQNPDGTYQAPTLVGTTATASISGIAFAPADGVNPDELWITTFGAAGNQLFRMPAAGGAGVAVANSLAGCNWIDYDRSQNDLLVATQAGLDRFMQVDRSTGLDTQLSQIQAGNAGVPASNDCNDAAFAATRVAPMILNGAVGPFDLEIGTSAPPGTLAVVGVGAPFVSILGVAVVGADGRLNVSFPGITLAGPIAPGTLTFLAAYFDASFNLVVGAPVAWPAL
jgi:hypothetical protein